MRPYKLIEAIRKERDSAIRPIIRDYQLYPFQGPGDILLRHATQVGQILVREVEEGSLIRRIPGLLGDIP